MLPKGLGNLGNMAGLMKQAMEMKSKMDAVKAQLADETVEATAGGGMVTVVVNGRFEVLSVKINPEAVDPSDLEMLETLIRAAVNEGIQRVQEMIKAKMSDMAGGMDIPGLTS